MPRGTAAKKTKTKATRVRSPRTKKRAGALHTRTVKKKRRQVTNIAKKAAAKTQSIFRPQPKPINVFFEKLRVFLKRYQILLVPTLVVVFGVAAFYFYTQFGLAVSDTRTITTQADWEAGEYWSNQFDTTTSKGDLKMVQGNSAVHNTDTVPYPNAYQDHGNGTYQAPVTSWGADIATDGTYLYMIYGNREPYFWRYNPDLGTWRELAEMPVGVRMGGALTYYDGVVYMINGNDHTDPGNASDQLMAYDIATDTWSRKADAPDTWGYGSDITAAEDGKLYAVRGRSTDSFWSYDISSDTWDDTLPSVASPYQIYTVNGHAIVYSGTSYGTDPVYCDAGCIYAFRGNSYRQFFRYDIDQNQWYDGFADVPTTLGSSGRIRYGSALAWDSTNGDLYGLTGYTNDEFMKYNIATETWDAASADTPDLQFTVQEGGSLAYLDNEVYILPANGARIILKYDVTNGYETITTPLPPGGNGEDDLMVFVPNGADCADSEGCLFAMRGANQTTFWRNDISTNTWTDLAVATGGRQRGASICYDGNDTIFSLEGDNTRNTQKYSISGNSWSSAGLIGVAGDEAYYGASITCLGDDDVFMIRGDNDFESFRGNGTAWTQDDGVPVRVYYGGALTSDGTYAYALAGYNRGSFYRFDPAAGAGSRWTELANMPEGAYYTGILEYDGDDRIFAIPGSGNENMWVYDITDDAWYRGPNVTGNARYAMAAAHDDANNILYYWEGLYSNAIIKYDTFTTDYVTSTDWISDTIDLTYVTSFNSFSSTSTTPGSSSITFQTRTSDNQADWSAWQTVTGGTTIQSTADRYIQVKVTLTSDGANAPTLSDFTINFEKDSNNPTNPTATGYSDSGKGTSITTGNTYYHTLPYFELAGGSDAESGLAGYYVSWTTNASHDPTSSEDYFQTGTTYEINSPLTSASTYYLRVAAKDQANNTAAVQTLFTYTYNGISPASSEVWTVQADFEQTGITDSNMNTAAGSGTNLVLDSVSNGVWTNENATPLGVNTGSSMAFDGTDTIYMFRGNNTNVFWSYDINTKQYTTLTDFGATVEYGGTMTYVPTGSQCADSEGCIFALQGDSTTTFKRYNINANTWTTLAVYAGGAVRYGANIEWGGGDLLFATRGNNTTDFYAYSISGGTWAPKNTPDGTVRMGGSLTYAPNGDYCSDPDGCLFGVRGNNTTDFWRYAISTNSWSYLSNLPSNAYYSTASAYANGYVYVARGTNYYQTDFYRYDILNDFWEWLPSQPNYAYTGGGDSLLFVPTNNELYRFHSAGFLDLNRFDINTLKWETPAIPYEISNAGAEYSLTAWDSDDELFYFARGENLSDWFAYDPATTEITRKTDVPQRVYYGGDAQYINGEIYLMPGTSQYEAVGYFYKYDPDADAWTRLADLPAEPGWGGEFEWDGSDSIYAVRGANTTTNYKYSISGDSWSTVVSTVPLSVEHGACMVRANDGGTDYLYLIPGNNRLDIYRFNIGTETWDAAATLTDAPASIEFGGACVLDGEGNILVPRGENTTTMYVYDISGDSWTSRTSLRRFDNGHLTMTNNNVVLGFTGDSEPTMSRYVVATASTGFVANGSWTSQIKDFTSGIYGYGGITLNVTDANDTALIIETRTCSDAGCAADPNDVNWGAWTTVTNNKEISGTDYYTVASSVAQYGQVRLTYSSDQLLSPTVHDVTWNYYTDATAPTNPTALSTLGYTQNGGTEITDATWVEDATPYFEWTASDNVGGIGVKGFHIYFGSDNTKDPITDAADPTNLAYVGGTNFYNVASDGVTGSWDALSQAASALTSDTYYLIIRTEDQNGNQATSSGTVFTYQLDILDPTTPTGVSASPAGYSSVDDFDFSWSASSDTGGSGVYEYCYKTNGAETCIPAASTSVTGLVSYQSRGNTFSVRARDEAGNYSSYASTTYYYSGPAPTAPASVTGSPPTSAGSPQEDTNSFSFSWTLPGTCLGQACDAADILRYCYTINELPSAENCGTNVSGTSTPSSDGGWTTTTQTTNRLLPGFSAATQQGLNTIYIVAADIINNIDYSNYTAEQFYFTSNAPGVPASAAVTDTSDRATQKYSVVMTWDEPADVGSGVEGYDVYRCEASCENPDPVDDPPTNYTKIANVNTLGYLDTGLDTLITYNYFARAAGTGGTQSGNSAVLEIKPEGKFKFAPTMSGQPVVTPYIRSALVEWLTLDDQDQYGNIIPHPASSFVEYGETIAYGNETGTSDLVSEHEVTLTNLTPDTTYHFRTKWTDVDGNTGYSPDFEFTTKGAPSAPTNLVATPTSNTTNSFAFSWSAPTDEGVTIAGYRYSVNNLPNAENVTETTETSLAAFDAATQQGINTFYVVAFDDTGNINYSNYAVVEFEAYTTPPGSPQAVTITDSSDRDAKRYSITITWDPPEGYTLDDEIYYTIDRSTDGATFESIAEITSTGYLDTGLDNAKTYYYKIVAQDKAKATSEFTPTVNEKPEGRYTKPPAITEGPVATPDSFSTTVAWRTERIASSFVEYGSSADSLTEEQGLADQVEAHEVKVAGLDPETKYYYRIKSIDVDENEAYSAVGSFTTLEAPRVLDLQVTDERLFDAIVTWETNKETTATIEYGTTTDYGLTFTDTSGSFAYTHTVKLENLSDGTTYNLRISGADKSGNKISSDNYTFTTLTFPEVSDITYENKAEGQTEVRWSTNVPTTSEVEYFSDNISPKVQGSAALQTEHTVLLFGLEDAARYQFVVRGNDEFGYEAESDEREFTTLEDTTPPEIFGVQSESNTIGSGEASKIQIVVSWKTNEATTSQVEYGVGLSGSDYTDETEESAELVLDHLVVITNLAPAKTYHFRVVSSDKAGNQTKSGSHTVLTSRERESFLQLIISNLETTFSWLGNIGSAF